MKTYHQRILCGKKHQDKVDLLANIVGKKGFSSLDLSGADLSGLTIESADFRHADLKNVKFKGATLIKCIFDSADLYRADFTYARLTDCDFAYAKLRYSKFFGASMCNVQFIDAQLEEADFENLTLFNELTDGGVSFQDCAFSRTRFDGSIIDRSSWRPSFRELFAAAGPTKQAQFRNAVAAAKLSHQRTVAKHERAYVEKRNLVLPEDILGGHETNPFLIAWHTGAIANRDLAIELGSI